VKNALNVGMSLMGLLVRYLISNLSVLFVRIRKLKFYNRLKAYVQNVVRLPEKVAIRKSAQKSVVQMNVKTDKSYLLMEHVKIVL